MSSVLGKIFRGKKTPCPKESAAKERHAKELLYPNGPTSPQLDSNRVRVVVFRDERGIKTPLFDSQINCEPDGGEEQRCTRSLCDMRSSERLEQSFTSSCSIPPSSSASQSAGWSENTTAKTRRAHFIRRPSTDSELLGEMMFGSMPMKVIGNTVKVHYIRSTDQLMLTKVFSFKRRPIQSCSLNDFSDSCSLAEETSRSPLRGSPLPKNRSFNNLRGTSPEYCKIRSSSLSVPASRPTPTPSTRSSSPYTHSPPSPHTLAPPISSSLTRRIQRSRSTSMENASELYRKVLKPLDQQSSSTQKGRKYAIGVIISLSEMSKEAIGHFQDFLFSHFTLIDAHLEQLKEGIEEACQCRGNTFTQMIAKAYKSFLEDFLLLYKAPRIQSPVWLNLVTSADHRRPVCIQFMEELASAIVELDTKDTKFFLSSLLTAVLSHHPAWLFTVTQQHTTNDNRHPKTGSKSLAVLAESHPYNPLWAQLGDLFGAISNPLKIARTVVTGEAVSVVCRLVYLLTYFIRCSEVQPGLVMQDSTFHDSSEPINMSRDTSHDPILIPQLEDSDKFESRASSVTVISEHERHFVSPVSIGRETPVIKPHPFGFKTTAPVSISSSTEGCRKSSESSSYGDSIAGLTGYKKSLSRSSDLSVTSACSSNKNSPLLSTRHHHFAPPVSDHMITAAKCIDTNSSNRFCESQTNYDIIDSREHSPKAAYCNCYHSNASMCAVVPTCESMGQCRIEDGFQTFDPNRKKKPSLLKMMTSPPLCRHDNITGNCGKTAPDAAKIHHSLHRQAYIDHNHSQTSPAHNQRTSCGSVDSGYDHSWAASSLSESSKFTESLLSTTAREGDDLNKFNSTSMIDACCLSPDLLGVGVAEVGGVTKPRSSSCGTYQLQQSLSSKTLSNGFCNSTDGLCNLDSEDCPTDIAPTSHTPSLPVIISTTPTCTTTNCPPSPGTCGTGEYIRQLSPGPSIRTQQEKIKRGFRTVNDQRLKQQKTRLTSPGNRFNSNDTGSSVDHLQVEQQSSSDSSVSTLQGSFPGVSSSTQMTSSTQSKTPSRMNDYTSRNASYNNQSNHSFPGHVTTHSSHVSAHPSHVMPTRITPDRTTSPLTTSAIVVNSAPPRLQPHPQGHTHSSTTPITRDTSTPSSLKACLDAQSLVSETDSGRCTKTWSQADVDTCSQDSVALSQISESSIYSEFSDDHSLSCGEGVNHFNHRYDDNGMQLTKGADSCPIDVEASLRIHQDTANTSLLHEKLSLNEGAEAPPEMLQRFTDIELPGLDDFTLDLPSDHWHDNSGYHGDDESATCGNRHGRKDFGHSLFVGHHPTYLPDFVLHGTSEKADVALQDKLVKDLGSMVKHSIIDEPIDYGVGIIGDTDLWTVKLLTASKSDQTNDVVISSSGVQFSRFIRQLLSSLKSMHEMRMPPEFCLSYLEDQLHTLSQRSIMLANNLTAYGSNADLTDILPKSMDILSIHKSDRPLLLALAAVNSPDRDISARLNHQYLVHQNLV